MLVRSEFNKAGEIPTVAGFELKDGDWLLVHEAATPRAR
jgi:hypothetical protein